MTALDGDLRTLHIRCGSDIFPALRAAGFVGDLLEYSDPICQGPVPDTPDLPVRRAQFVAAAYGASAERVAAMAAAEDAVAAAHLYPRVVLWFEHDSYDQLLLARCLALFADGVRPAVLELICIDRHPSVARFIGLGQLDAAALAGLWPDRVAVTHEDLARGRAVWAALRAADPSGLAALAAVAPAVMGAALRRHLAELPGVADGLSLTQLLVLRIVAEAPVTIGRVFGALMGGKEPLPFLGDLMLLPIVEDMAATGVLALAAAEQPFARVLSITGAGRAVLAGAVDYLALGPAERWVGGVLVGSGWRWDAAGGGVVFVGRVGLRADIGTRIRQDAGG